MAPSRSSRIARRAAWLALALVAAGCGAREVEPPADLGQRVFERTVGGLACADCHGAVAAPPDNPDWRLPGRPLGGVATREALWGGRFKGPGAVTEAALFCAARFQYRMLGEVVRKGAPRDFSGVPLSAEERAAVARYVSGFAGPPERLRLRRTDDVHAVLEIAGDPDRGELLWAAACAVCHGAEAEGGLGPRLRGIDVLDPFSLVEYVRLAADTEDRAAWMPFFGPDDLSPQDLADLASRYTE